MRRRGMTTLALVSTLLLGGCEAGRFAVGISIGSSEEAPGSPSSGSGSDGSGGGGGAAVGGESDELDIPVAVVGDTACVPRGGMAVELYPGDPGAPVFGRLAIVGDRYVAANALGLEGFVTFDGDGVATAPPPTIIGASGNHVATEGDTFGVAAYDDGSAIYRRFDDVGSPLGDVVQLGSAKLATTVEIAGGEGEAVVVWAQGGALAARGIDADGNAHDASITFGGGTYGASASIAVARRAGEFAAVWSGYDSGTGLYMVWFATLDLSGASVSEPVQIASSDERQRAVRLAATPAGYAVLLTGPPPQVAPFVLLLDEAGASIGPAYRLEGAYFGWDLAVRDGAIGVLAARATGEPELRAFAEDMTPLGPWVCLDAPSDISDMAAIAATADGWAVVYRRADPSSPGDGQELFVELDTLGTESP